MRRIRRQLLKWRRPVPRVVLLPMLTHDVGHSRAEELAVAARQLHQIVALQSPEIQIKMS